LVFCQKIFVESYNSLGGCFSYCFPLHFNIRRSNLQLRKKL
jgi:hypothetical protein